MRTVVATLLLLGGCASRDAAIPERFFDCRSGQDVSVDLRMTGPGVAMENTTDHLTMFVDVANNGHVDIVVNAIRVEPVPDDAARYALERSYRKFGRVLPGGESHVFELPVVGRGLARTSTSVRRGDTLTVNVSVYLGNGDAYRCEMFVPSPR